MFGVLAGAKDLPRLRADQDARTWPLRWQMRQLDEMTQHNAALVEETNAAIEQTDGQVNELDRIVDIFTISGAAPQRVVQVAPPARGIKGLQERVKKAASSYLSQGNAAIDKDWAEF